MRRLFMVFLMLSASPVLAHDEDHCLEHHWMQPEYQTEIRYQLVLMAAVIAAISLYKLTMWLKKVRKCG
jgi:hypothetical protein